MNKFKKLESFLGSIISSITGLSTICVSLSVSTNLGISFLIALICSNKLTLSGVYLESPSVVSLNLIFGLAELLRLELSILVSSTGLVSICCVVLSILEDSPEVSIPKSLSIGLLVNKSVACLNKLEKLGDRFKLSSTGFCKPKLLILGLTGSLLLDISFATSIVSSGFSIIFVSTFSGKYLSKELGGDSG